MFLTIKFVSLHKCCNLRVLFKEDFSITPKIFSFVNVCLCDYILDKRSMEEEKLNGFLFETNPPPPPKICLLTFSTLATSPFITLFIFTIL